MVDRDTAASHCPNFGENIQALGVPAGWSVRRSDPEGTNRPATLHPFDDELGAIYGHRLTGGVNFARSAISFGSGAARSCGVKRTASTLTACFVMTPDCFNRGSK